MTDAHHALARRLADRFADCAHVEAAALGGSIASGTGSEGSDIDLYIFSQPIVPLAFREALIEAEDAQKAALALNFWDPGDAWFDRESGIEVDVMYWSPDWIADQLDRVIEQHQASLGYSTCHWHTIRRSLPLFDRQGWLTGLKHKADAPYPEALRVNIIEKNTPVLRDAIPAYAKQIKKAVQREDLVSLNHRITGLLASYFDILFALNRLPHPGEKRLLDRARALCPLRPLRMTEDVTRLLELAAQPGPELLAAVDALVDHLLPILRAEGF